MRGIVLVGPRGDRWHAQLAWTRRERVRGLLGQGGLAEGEALLIERARSVHTFGMRFPIRVAFLDRDLTVVSVRSMAPRRLALPRRRVRHVLEWADRPGGPGLLPGDRLHVEGLPTQDALG